MRGREEKQSSVGGEDWRKYEMGRKGEVCVGGMVNRWDGGTCGVTWWSWGCGGREKWREGKVEGGSLRPVSVVPTTAPLLFLNPAVLVDVTTIL